MSWNSRGFHQWIVCSCLFVAAHAGAQVEKQQNSTEQEKTTKAEPISTSGEEVLKALDKNDEENIARNYEALANKFVENENFQKGEEYLKKALKSYKQLKRPDDIARVSRSLAKVQEKLHKTVAAISNYSLASSSVLDATEKKINQSDANRLSYFSDQSVQANSINSNISVFKRENRFADLQDAYDQKANMFLLRNDFEGAIQTYKQAIAAAGNNSALIIQWKDKIADVYVRSKAYDQAIAIHTDVLSDARRLNQVVLQIRQLRHLSAIYFETGASDKALSLLKQSYQLALNSSNTKEVKTSLTKLLSYYREVGNQAERIALYDEFFRNFDELIRSDSTLIDINTFQVIEGKIRQLEKEKKLKDRLIANTNTFNYFLIGSLIVLLVLLGLFIRALLSIKKKNKKIALQSLRREMNPHFIFNSLNSVNQFISQNNELEANKYLTSYSNLMRSTMENSGKDFILLGKEVELLKKYLDLELMRFEAKFDFMISVDENLDPETSYVPNMLIQPNLENAIWHGLRYLDGKGLLQLHFAIDNNSIRVTIDDNGIGIAKSRELKTRNQKVYDSLGLKNTQERIALLNNLYRKNISFCLAEKPAPEQGTIVEMVFPLMDKLPG